MSEIMKSIVAEAVLGPLSSDRAIQAFNEIMSGKALESQIAGFLIALKMRGETVEEISAAAKVMLDKCNSVNAPKGTLDIVGTGGDGKGTLNISTATALVVASCNIYVAKHGNKNISSQSGSADVLKELEVNLEVTPQVVERCIEKAHIGFLFAPAHHPAVKHVMPTRQALATRTIFNILGPLTNPAKIKNHLVGAYSKDLLVPMARVLKELGSQNAWLVFGEDGTDEISITGKTHVVELKKGKISSFEINPEDAGLSSCSIQSILGGSPKENALALKQLIAGQKSPYRDAVLLNAGAALIVSGKVQSLADGVQIAGNAIDSGATHATLKTLVKETQTKND